MDNQYTPRTYADNSNTYRGPEVLGKLSPAVQVGPREGGVAAEMNRVEDRISAASVALDQLTEVLGPLLADARPTATDNKLPPPACGLAQNVRTQADRVNTLYCRIQDLLDRVML